MLSPFADDRSLFRIIRAAQWAPSVLNTQPWSFWVRTDDRIELRANIAGVADSHPGRWLKVIDPIARELAISCGAALFNLQLAIRVGGHNVAALLLPDPEGDPTLLASVEVEVAADQVRPATAEEQDLYDAISKRHTYRWPFSLRQVPASLLAEIISAAAKERGWLRVLTRRQMAWWLRVAAQAEDELIRDELYVAELRHWTSGARAGLGVPRATYGPRPVYSGAPIAPIRDFGLAWRDDRPAEYFERHPQLLSLATSDDRPLDWLRAGQALQRALLTAAHYGVAASFLTQPLELADRRGEPRWPATWPYDEVPQMLIRMGYPAHPVPVTPREARPDVVDLRSHPPRHVLPPGLPAAERELSSRWHPPAVPRLPPRPWAVPQDQLQHRRPASLRPRQ